MTDIDVREGQTCPNCGKNTLTITETIREIHYFGKTSLYSMRCQNEYCDFFEADVESLEDHGPIEVSFTVKKEEDVNIRVVKASSATVVLGDVGSIESSEKSSGYITTIEGVLNRMQSQIRGVKRHAEDEETMKKAQSHLETIDKVIQGEEDFTVTIKDKKGNSMIIHEDAVVTKLDE